MKKKLVLVGYMGAGKTSISNLLADKLSIEGIDLDQLIEKNESMSLSEIFEKKGEIYYRKQENYVFQSLIENDVEMVVSTGGGTPCYYNNHLYLQNDNVYSFYLQASVDTLFERLKTSSTIRPLLLNLKEKELKDFIGAHLFERSHYYLNAKYIINVDGKTIADVVDEIILKLN